MLIDHGTVTISIIIHETLAERRNSFYYNIHIYEI